MKIEYTKRQILEMVRDQHQKDLDSLIEWLQESLPEWEVKGGESERFEDIPTEGEGK